MDRRGFLKAAGTAGLVAATATGAVGARADDDEKDDEGKNAELKLSSQEGLVPGRELEEKIEHLHECGYVGIEFQGGGITKRVEDIKETLEGSNVKPSAICAGYEGCLISEDSEKRETAVRTIKGLVEAGEEIGATGVIVVPAFNGQTSLGNREAREILVKLLKEIGPYAEEHECPVMLEPLNRREAFFLRQLADAASICRDVDSPGVRMMGDFYHMCIEETSDRGAFLSAGEHLRHVHLASRGRRMPGQDDRSFVDGFKGLKEIGYRYFCSLECGIEGDAEEELKEAAKLLKEQWEEA
jgi:sugar phosphate isomerase/epimerase